MLLKSNKDFWNLLANNDPLWAILSIPSKRHNRWEANDFFKSGEVEVDAIISELRKFSVLNKTKTAIDFGCGVGRCTRRLAKYFRQVYGLDISGIMIEKAIEFNKNIGNCTYEEINGISLSNFNDRCTDFILSIITFQHLNEEVQLAYLKEFFRILSAKGILYLQTVTGYSNSFYGLLKRFTKNKIANLYNKFRYDLESPIEMHICKESEILKLIDLYEMDIIAKYKDKRAGKSLISSCYILQKNN